MSVDLTSSMLWLVSWGCLNAWLAETRARRPVTWFWLGALLGPLGTGLLLWGHREEEPLEP